MIAASQTNLPYALINPCCYEPPIAPHIAADLCNQKINIKDIISSYQQLRAQSDVVIIEGAGGWLVPINQQQTLENLAIQLQLPIILVVGIRLGCLNHALLTQQAIKQSGLTLAGWVANIITPDMPYIKENIHHLELTIQAPLLGTVYHQTPPDYAHSSQFISLP